MKKLLLIIFCLMGMLLCIQAQSITGRLIDLNKEPIAFANVVLQQADSTFLIGTTSDTNGNFALEAKTGGNNHLVISFVGYEKVFVNLNGQVGKIKLGDLVMHEITATVGEVQVVASNVSRKVDRQVVLPSQTQLKTSTSGYDLLDKLMLPGLKIDPIQNSISTASGGSVEVRINDIRATQPQILALRPQDVVRVEYIDNPGVRYSDTGIEAVINYIVKRKNAGVAGGIQGMNALMTGFGNDNVYVTANTGKSEFGLDYFLSYRDYEDRFADGTDRFLLADGTERIRELKGVSVPFGYTQHTLEASYNLTEPDKYVLNVLFKDEFSNTSKQNHLQRIFETGKDPLFSYTHATDRNNNPSLDLYYQLTMPKEQKLSLNVVGTYINTDYMRDYKEYMDESATTSHYTYSTEGNRYSLIGEAIYEKGWKDFTLSAGVKGTTAYTNNAYTGSTNEVLNMHNSNLYGYLQLQGKLVKLNYMLGAGVSRQTFSQSEEGFTFVTFRPSLSLSYPVFKGANLRYTFSVSPNTPSLSNLSEVQKQLTDIEVNVGNSELSPFRAYNNRLVFSWGMKNISTQLTGYYTYYDSPITQQVERVDDEDGNYMFIYRMANQKNYRNVGGQLSVQWKIIPDFLSLGVNGGVNWYSTEGENFAREYTSWFGGANLSTNYKNFSLMAGVSSRYNSLFGEYISYGENNSYIQLNYRYKRLTVGAACLYPFQPKGWSAGSLLNSELVTKKSWTYIKDNGNMLCLSASWTFNYGRNHKAGKKTLNNVDKDSGIVK